MHSKNWNWYLEFGIKFVSELAIGYYITALMAVGWQGRYTLAREAEWKRLGGPCANAPVGSDLRPKYLISDHHQPVSGY